MSSRLNYASLLMLLPMLGCDGSSRICGHDPGAYDLVAVYRLTLSDSPEELANSILPRHTESLEYCLANKSRTYPSGFNVNAIYIVDEKAAIYMASRINGTEILVSFEKRDDIQSFDFSTECAFVKSIGDMNWERGEALCALKKE